MLFVEKILGADLPQQKVFRRGGPLALGADMDGNRFFHVADFMPLSANAEAEVLVLAVQEEVFVKTPEAAEDLRSREHRGTEDAGDPPRQILQFVPAVSLSGVAVGDGRLQGPIRVDHFQTGQSDGSVAVHIRNGPAQRVRLQGRVWVQEQDVSPGTERQGLIAGGAEAAVFLIDDQPNAGKLAADEDGASVRGGVVYDDRFRAAVPGGIDGLQACADQVGRVVGYDDDGNVRRRISFAVHLIPGFSHAACIPDRRGIFNGNVRPTYATVFGADSPRFVIQGDAERGNGEDMRYFNLLRNVSNAPLYLAVKFGWTGRDPLLFRTRTGVLIEVPRRLLQTFKEIFMDECYVGPPGLPKQEGATVIDIGANAGFFTLFAAARLKNPRVAAYEPVPANFRQLERNRELNPGCRIRTFQAAVAGNRGEIALAFDPNDAFTTDASMYKDASPGVQAIRVPCVTIADAFSENGFGCCDLLKLDCEGAEYDILYGCPPEILSAVGRIAMEVHQGPGPGQNIDTLESFLKEKGFRTFRRPVGMLWAWR